MPQLRVVSSEVSIFTSLRSRLRCFENLRHFSGPLTGEPVDLGPLLRRRPHCDNGQLALGSPGEKIATRRSQGNKQWQDRIEA